MWWWCWLVPVPGSLGSGGDVWTPAAAKPLSCAANRSERALPQFLPCRAEFLWRGGSHWWHQVSYGDPDPDVCNELPGAPAGGDTPPRETAALRSSLFLCSVCSGSRHTSSDRKYGGIGSSGQTPYYTISCVYQLAQARRLCDGRDLGRDNNNRKPGYGRRLHQHPWHKAGHKTVGLIFKTN